MRAGSCVFCVNSKRISADKKQWLIHLSGHREQMIRYVVEQYPNCVLCSHSESFTDKPNFERHVRWVHDRKTLIDWAFQNTIK